MRRAARIDDNQPDIVAAAKGVGCSVWVTSGFGAGAPDIVVGCPRTHKNFLIEIKDGAKAPSRRKLTEDETVFHRQWVGSIAVIETVDQLYQLLGVQP